MSQTGESAGELFRAGRLQDAVAAAGAALKRAPSDLGARVLLSELLLFTGNVERADVILDAAADMAPDAALVIAEFRQLLRAELARRQLFRDGRVPEFLGDPTPAQSAALAALVAWRAGDMAEAGRCAEAAEALRPRVQGQVGGQVGGQAGGQAGNQAFDDFRDADDLAAPSFEVLSTTGKFFWIPTERVESIVFHPPRRPRDLFWRRASMTVHDGPEGDVYLPVIYAADEPGLDPNLLLGRATDWREDGVGPVRGMGQREFVAGEQALGIMELTELRFGA